MLAPIRVHCPYCGEPIELLVEPTPDPQCYLEDCHVCCRPITVRVTVDADGAPVVEVAGEDEA